MRTPGAVAALAAALLLAGCGDSGGGDQQSAQQVAQGHGGDGALVSLPQAQQAAQQWWDDHEQALLRRDAVSLSRLDAVPLARTEVELVRTALSTGSGILPEARHPSAVRVHVPAPQSWPVPLLAVYDLSGSGGAQLHVAVLLVRLNPGAEPVAVESATLDVPEPAFDLDPAGYVRMGPASTGLGTAYAQYMEDVVHATPAPSPAPLAPGKRTSDAAAADAALLHDPTGHSHGNLSTVDIDYTAVNAAAPVFQLAGGGGFSFVATQRNETLHPMPGQALLQDGRRRNYGVDLAPGQYPQITVVSMQFLAVVIPAGGGPAEVRGSGGGVVQEG
jgi:hypothetical protein